MINGNCELGPINSKLQNKCVFMLLQNCKMLEFIEEDESDNFDRGINYMIIKMIIIYIQKTKNNYTYISVIIIKRI